MMWVANHLGDVAQFISAIVLALTYLQSWRNGRKANQIAENVQTIEKATNSMKDALVAATAKASLAEGTAAGLQQGRAESKG